MDILILLLILAVLLFGSSVVLGGLGYVLGFIAAAIALTYASVTFEITAVEVVLYGVAGFAVLIAVFYAFVYLFDFFYPHEKRIKKETEKYNIDREAKLSSMYPEQRKAFLKAERKRVKKQLKEFEKQSRGF